jgi:DNA-binding Lrp family transcriptional regulator
MVSAMGIVMIVLAPLRLPNDGPVLAWRAKSGNKSRKRAASSLARAAAFRLYYINAPFPETTAMVPFFVQFKCKLGQSYIVANALAEAEIASEIYSTAGDYDLLVKFYVDNETDIGHFVNEKVQVIPGIQDTHTIITFKAFGSG